MTARLADVYQPLPFNRALDQKATELNRFFQSGILRADSTIDDMASSGGTTGELAFFDALATPEPNYSTDDPSSNSTPQGITGGKQIYRLAAMNQSWSTMDLARELGLKDPLSAIVEKIAQYWATIEQRRLINSCVGILLDNVANDSSDMVLDVSNNDAGPVLDAESLTAANLLAAKQLKGDHAGMLTTLAVHSVIHTNLQTRNLITFVSDSEGNVAFERYLTYNLVVDDDLPAVNLGNRIQYTSVLFAPGACGYGRGRVAVPSEMDREPSAGDGGGQDLIYTRRNRIIHPYGFQFTSSSVAGQSATYAELANAANWDRVHSNKNIGMVFIRTNA
jgi:hypothetical protein